MKCDELEEEFLWTNNVKTPSTRMVRAYNADEVDKAIAELKARIQLDDDEMAGFLDLEEECGGGDLRNYIAELKADNERLKNKMDDYHLMSDNRRAKIKELKRALWLARANSAEGQFSYWCARLAVESGFTKTEIRGYTVNTKRKLRTIGEWIKTWKQVERKCRAKAKAYK